MINRLIKCAREKIKDKRGERCEKDKENWWTKMFYVPKRHKTVVKTRH